MGEWGGHAFLKVSRFREKPSIDLAKEFVESGHHLWNAGMFVFTVGALKDGYGAVLPRTSEALERVTQNSGRPRRRVGQYGCNPASTMG